MRRCKWEKPLFPNGVDPFGLWEIHILKSMTFCILLYCQIFDATAAGHTLTEIANRYPVIWPGLPFTNNIDAIVPWPNGKLYFFKGDQYAAVDVATGKADPGYPRPINEPK